MNFYSHRNALRYSLTICKLADTITKIRYFKVKNAIKWIRLAWNQNVFSSPHYSRSLKSSKATSFRDSLSGAAGPKSVIELELMLLLPTPLAPMCLYSLSESSSSSSDSSCLVFFLFGFFSILTCRSFAVSSMSKSTSYCH